MAKAFLVLGTDEQLRALQHLLHHYARGVLNLHHAVELQCQVFGGAYVQRHAANVALVNGSHHLGHYGEADPFGKGRQLVLRRAHQLRHHGDTGTRQQFAHRFGLDVAILADARDDLVQPRYVYAVELHFGRCRGRRAHDLTQRCGQCHLVAEVHVTLGQKLGHLGACRVQTGQNGEDGLAALANFLVQHVVCLVELGQSRRAVDDGNGIDVRQLLLAVVNGRGQLLGRACGKDVDGVGNCRTRQQLRLQFLGHLALNLGHVQSALRQRVGQHDTRAAGVGDNGKVLALQRGQGEDATHGGQLLTAETAHNARLAEQRLDGSVARCNGSRVGRSCPAAALAGTGLDGCNVTTLLN